MNAQNKIFFPNLDALRFFAFFTVFLSHVLLIHFPATAEFGYANFIRNQAQTGVLGVNFFFVLSGFLITYLLLKEKNEKGEFSISKFYIRRILRIWPLYFAIVLFSFVVLPLVMPLLNKVFIETSLAIFYFTFTVNFAFIIGYYPHSSLLAMLWSISVEEQFYFFWPWLLQFFKNNIFILLMLIIVVTLISRFLLLPHSKSLYFNSLCIISDFGMGGLISFLSLKYPERFIRLVSVSKTVTLIFYFSIAVIFFFYEKIFTGSFMIWIERPVLGILFGLIIIDQCFNAKRIFNAGKFSIINYFGKISFGLYCYHPLGIILAKDLLVHFHCMNSAVECFVLFPLISFSLTVLIASISYNTLEKYFLRKKIMFAS